jgi:hypothetical protein
MLSYIWRAILGGNSCDVNRTVFGLEVADTRVSCYYFKLDFMVQNGLLHLPGLPTTLSYLLLGSDKNLLPSDLPDSTCPPEKYTKFLWRAGDYKSGDSRSVGLPLTSMLVHNSTKRYFETSLGQPSYLSTRNYLEILLMLNLAT